MVYYQFCVYPESTSAHDFEEAFKSLGCPVVHRLHDRDLNDDGTLKKAHWQGLIALQRSDTSINRVIRDLNKMGVSINCMPRFYNRTGSAECFLRYLLHEDEKSLADEHKFRYEPDSLVFWNGSYDDFVKGDAKTYRADLFAMADDGASLRDMLLAECAQGALFNEVKGIYEIAGKDKREASKADSFFDSAKAWHAEYQRMVSLYNIVCAKLKLYEEESDFEPIVASPFDVDYYD